jgi:hypothetical protein
MLGRQKSVTVSQYDEGEGSLKKTKVTFSFLSMVTTTKFLDTKESIS